MADGKFFSYDDDETFDANVAAIDFGTTFCSLVYKVKGSDITETLMINETFDRVPTAILIEKDGNGLLTVKDIGYIAQERYLNLPSSEYKSYLYFECFKMQLRDEENLTQGTTISTFTGADYYIIEVIALILQHLRLKFEERLSRSQNLGLSMRATDFHWVLTVPAIWKNRGKQIMREAAYRAGLLGDVQPINKFTTPPISLSEPNIPLLAKKRLVLALEPECAALYCQQLSSSMVATHCDQLPVGDVISDRYMILDIGGGTVDVAIHKLSGDDKKIDSVLPPTGNDWGGTKVNDQFSILLQNILQDKNFDNFCSANGKEALHKAVISELSFRHFEMVKKCFGENSNIISITSPQQTKTKKQLEFIRLHQRLVEFYKTALSKLQPVDGIEFDDDDDVIIITYSKMEEFFQPAINGILSCMTSAMSSSPVPIDTIYLVGGFGGCPYVYSKVKEALGQQNIKVIVPSNYKLAVALGAVIFRQKISAIFSRVSDAYYGIATHITYDPEKHDRARKVYNDEKKCFDVKNHFSILIEKGQSVKFNKKFQGTYLPLKSTQTRIEFRIYHTTKDDVTFVKDIRGNPIPGIDEVGKITIPAPINGLKREERETKVEIMLGGTELHVRAVYIPTGEDVNATIDFLKK